MITDSLSHRFTVLPATRLALTDPAAHRPRMDHQTQVWLYRVFFWRSLRSFAAILLSRETRERATEVSKEGFKQK